MESGERLATRRAVLVCRQDVGSCKQGFLDGVQGLCGDRYIRYLFETDRFSVVFGSLSRKHYNAVFDCTVEAFLNREDVDQVVARRPSVRALGIEDGVRHIAAECL